MTPRTRTKLLPTPLRTPGRVVGLVLGVLVVLVMLLLASSLGSGPFVRRLVIDNQTKFDANIHLGGVNRDGWFDLGTTASGTEGVLEQIPDPGGTWVIRFSYAGVEGAELTIARSALRAAGWRLGVPAEIGERLSAAGLSPSAR